MFTRLKFVDLKFANFKVVNLKVANLKVANWGYLKAVLLDQEQNNVWLNEW